MFNFINDISMASGVPLNEVTIDVKVCMVGGRALWVSNFVKILSYSHDKIVLKVKKDYLNISGENLIIRECEKQEIIVSGIIKKIYFGNGE